MNFVVISSVETLICEWSVTASTRTPAYALKTAYDAEGPFSRATEMEQDP